MCSQGLEAGGQGGRREGGVLTGFGSYHWESILLVLCRFNCGVF